MRKALLLLTLTLSVLAAEASLFKDGGEMFNRRLGMFIHWGIPADEYANECMVVKLEFPAGALK